VPSSSGGGSIVVRKPIALLLLSSSLALGLVSGPAGADSWTWRDRGGRGPLAIGSVAARHSSPSGMPYVTVTFERRLKPSKMGPKDFVGVDYEGNGKRPSEGWIYVVARRGRLVSFEYNPSTGETYGSMFRRVSPRTLEVVPWNYNAGGIGFAAVSYSENAAAGCGGGCWDLSPNRGFLVHDWTAPEFHRFDAPDPPDDFWYEPRVPVAWRAGDSGFSGLARTSVVWRDPGAARWQSLVTRTAPGMQEASVPVVQGAHMLMQGLAEDGAGNTAASYPTLLRIPFDDANESGPGTFTGGWARQDDPEASHGSVNVGTGPGATLTFAGRGNLYCVVVKWLDALPARARLQVGDRAEDLTHDAGAPAGPSTRCVRTESAAEQVATFVVVAGRLGVDGYWSGDDGTAPVEAAPSDAPHEGLVHVGESSHSLRMLREAAGLR
jgi:hypothetical protein